MLEKPFEDDGAGGRGAGPSPEGVYLTDADYDAIIRDVLTQAPPGDLWLFDFGSL